MTTQLQHEPKSNWKESHQFIDGLWWGAVLIWAGLVFVADSMGYLYQEGNINVWTWVFLGAGVLALILNAWRLLVPDVAPPTLWDYVWTAIFLILGLSAFANFTLSWPLFVIVLGLVIVISTVLRRE
jgi:hypothetical protein